MCLQEIVSRMDSEERVTVKGIQSNRGFEVAAHLLKKYLYKVEKISGNKRGGVSLTIDELEFEYLARTFGYKL